jgi:hypothetical protein
VAAPRLHLRLLLPLCGALACAAAAPARYAQPAEGDSQPVALISDTQRTLLLERLLGREQNDAERAALVADLAARRPGLLAMLGDLTNQGGSAAAWEELDALLAPVRAAGIPLLAVLGNHDYWGGRESALQHAAARVPQLRRARWFLHRWGRVGLVFLDSNEVALGEPLWSQQRDWYERTLRALDADPGIAAALVLDHHPPFTNSRTTGDEEDVQRAFLPAFFSSRKAVAFVSGHAHTHERFRVEGRVFVVMGGGGGPRVRLLEGREQRHADLVRWPSPRPFHYLWLEQGARGVRCTVRGLQKGETQVRDLDAFELPFPE